jgi:hypothetical protein
VLVTPNDGTVDGPVAQAQVTVANTPPVATVAFEPVSPTKGGALKAVATATDADDDTVTFTYAWLRDGQTTTFAGDTIAADQLARGQQWQVTVTPNDGAENGPSATASVTIGNAQPVIASVALAPENPTKATALSAAPAAPSDLDGDVVTLRYEWRVNGTVIDGQTGPNLATSFFNKGQVVTVTITPNDTKDDGVPASASVTIGNIAPTAPVATITPNPRDADDITCSIAVLSADLDATDTLTYLFTWTKNGQPFSGATNQATSSVVPAALTAEQDIFGCLAAVADGVATIPAIANVSARVNARPVLASVALSPSSPTKATTLSASPAAPSDLDRDVVTLRYGWLVNGTVGGQTGPNLAPGFFNKGQVVTVVVTPNDTKEDGAPVSASVTIGNSAPTAPVATITPNPRDADDITCSIAISSADLDAADTISYLFSWTKNGQPFSGATNLAISSVVPNALTADGDVFACTVAASDGTATTPGDLVSTMVSNCPAGAAFDTTISRCATQWQAIPQFSGIQVCGPYYTIILPVPMNQFRPTGAASVSGGFLSGVASGTLATDLESGGCRTAIASDESWAIGTIRTLRNNVGCSSPRDTAFTVTSLTGCGAYNYRLEGRRVYW